jgi:tetratricopeptide (TPR) repeat protein
MSSLFAVLAVCAGLCLAHPALADSDEAVERNHAGAKLIERGSFDAAIVEFRNAIRLDGKYFPARLNLAYAYERANRFEEAIDAYRDAIEAQPQSFFAHNNLAVLYDKKGLYDDAIAAFEKALEIEAGNALALKNLEVAKKNKMIVQERSARCMRAEQEARAKPNDPRASYNVARTYAFYAQKEPALEWLTRALKQGYKDLQYLKIDPAFESMRDDPEFQRLTKP